MFTVLLFWGWSILWTDSMFLYIYIFFNSIDGFVTVDLTVFVCCFLNFLKMMTRVGVSCRI